MGQDTAAFFFSISLKSSYKLSNEHLGCIQPGSVVWEWCICFLTCFRQGSNNVRSAVARWTRLLYESPGRLISSWGLRRATRTAEQGWGLVGLCGVVCMGRSARSYRWRCICQHRWRPIRRWPGVPRFRRSPHAWFFFPAGAMHRAALIGFPPRSVTSDPQCIGGLTVTQVRRSRLTGLFHVPFGKVNVVKCGLFIRLPNQLNKFLHEHSEADCFQPSLIGEHYSPLCE